MGIANPVFFNLPQVANQRIPTNAVLMLRKVESLLLRHALELETSANSLRRAISPFIPMHELPVQRPAKPLGSSSATGLSLVGT
jgi:hypothetical protein